MAFFSAEADWTEAKKTFEAVAGKKRPGMNVSKLASFIKSYRAHTGLTPVCKALDKALDAADKGWSKADLPGKAKLVAAIANAETALKDKGKGYIAVLAKSIQTELEDGDGRGELMRALQNLTDAVTVLLKTAKGKRINYEVQYDGLKAGKGQVEAIKDSILLASPAALSKIVAGMKVMVRNIKAKPEIGVWMKEISGDPPTRWATTKLKDLAQSFKKHPALQDKVGADPAEFEKKLNLYGAGKDLNYWTKELGKPEQHKAEILKHAKLIEAQIPNLEILHDRLKAALKSTAL